MGRWCTVVRKVVSSGMFRFTCAPGIGKTSPREHAKMSAYSVSSLTTSFISSALRSLPILTLCMIYSTLAALNGSVGLVKMLSVFMGAVFAILAYVCAVSCVFVSCASGVLIGAIAAGPDSIVVWRIVFAVGALSASVMRLRRVAVVLLSVIVTSSVS